MRVLRQKLLNAIFSVLSSAIRLLVVQATRRLKFLSEPRIRLLVMLNSENLTRMTWATLLKLQTWSCSSFRKTNLNKSFHFDGENGKTNYYSKLKSSTVDFKASGVYYWEFHFCHTAGYIREDLFLFLSNGIFFLVSSGARFLYNLVKLYNCQEYSF